jgi:hypothetical protein
MTTARYPTMVDLSNMFGFACVLRNYSLRILKSFQVLVLSLWLDILLVRSFRFRFLRIRRYVVLHLQLVEHIEISVQLIVLFQSLQITDCGSGLHRQT